MSIPDELQYTAEHEWVRIEGETAVVGITAYAAEQLGDVVYVELPAVGRNLSAGEVIGELESTKSVGELYAPVAGTVAEVNQAVVDAPETVNEDAYGAGWLVKVQLGDAAPPVLLSAAEYAALIGR